MVGEASALVISVKLRSTPPVSLPKPKWAEEVFREDSCGLRDIL
jgi:hypothetical protein